MEAGSQADSPQSNEKKKDENIGKLPDKNITKTSVYRRQSSKDKTSRKQPVIPVIANDHDTQAVIAKDHDTQPVIAKDHDTQPVEAKDLDTQPVEEKDLDTQPVEANDHDTQPVEANDHDTQPVEEKDHDTQPVEEKDHDTQPVVEKDHDTQPAIAKDHDTQPVEAKDHDTQPAIAKDHDTQPVVEKDHDTQPAIAKDHDTQPAIAKDHDTKPVEAKDHDTKPVEAKDHDTQPIVSKDCDTQPDAENYLNNENITNDTNTMSCAIDKNQDVVEDNTTKTSETDISILDTELHNTDKSEIHSDVPNVNEKQEDIQGKTEPKQGVSAEADEDSDEEKQIVKKITKKNDPKSEVTIADMIDNAIHCFEEEDYMKCMVICEEILNTNWKVLSDHEKFATAFLYVGKCYEKVDELENALKNYHFSLAVSKSLSLSRHIVEITFKLEEKLKKSAEEENKKGNECFKSKQFKEALAHYTEAIKRNPEQAKFFSNRSACYLKVKEHLLSLSDAQNGIRLEPKSVKGYFREGAAYLALNKPSKACASYSSILQIDPDNEEAKKHYSKSTEKARLDPNDAEAVKKRIEEEPELIQILNDRHVRLFLSEMEKDPTAVKKYMHDISTRKKIQKLLECGLLNAGSPNHLLRS